jgi:hypothetical protein
MSSCHNHDHNHLCHDNSHFCHVMDDCVIVVVEFYNIKLNNNMEDTSSS